jgi:hypothetical protein
MAIQLKMKSGKASFQNYEMMNKNVVGPNYDEINKDRVQLGKKPIDKKTQYANERTGEI